MNFDSRQRRFKLNRFISALLLAAPISFVNAQSDYYDRSKRHTQSGFYKNYLQKEAARNNAETNRDAPSANADVETIAKPSDVTVSKSYGYLPHSELIDIMHSPKSTYEVMYPSKRKEDSASGFLLVEARYSGSACLSVEILETVFFEPSPYFLKRAKRKFKRACDDALLNLATDTTEVHYLTIPIIGKLIPQWIYSNCLTKKPRFTSKNYCEQLLSMTHRYFNPSTTLTLEEVQALPPFSEQAQYGIEISNLLFYLSNTARLLKEDESSAELLWQALWYLLFSGEDKFYLRFFPDELAEQIHSASELARTLYDSRLANTLVIMDSRLSRSLDATTIGSEALNEIEARVASLAPYEVLVQLPQNYPLLNSRSYASIPLNKRKVEVKSEVRGIEHIQVSCGYGHYADLSQVKLEIGKKLKFPDRRDCRLEFFGTPNSSIKLRFFD